MCFFGSPAQPSEQVVNQDVPAPTPPPQAPADTPGANQDKSKETQDSQSPGATGYGSLIIPRTALTPVSRAPAQG